MEIEKGLTDKLEYRTIILENNLRVILARDSETQKSAAAVRVDVGSYEEERSHQGLAHFLEHMLFMGSEKFPRQAEFDEYVSGSAGENNAYTSNDHTVYYFAIPNGHFEKALDIFSQFFISPLLKEECVDKEVHAVDSEFRKDLPQDGWRLQQLLQALMNPDCLAYNMNHIGNLDTLQKADVISKLRTFYENQYSANRITLAICSDRPLDETEALARSYFSPVLNRELKPVEYRVKTPFFRPEDKGKLVEMVSISTTPSLQFVFLIPSMLENWKDGPEEVLAKILGDEYKGSLIDRLIEEELAFDLTSSRNHYSDAFTTIELSVNLSSRGFTHYKRVIELIGKYIHMLRQQGIPETIFSEMKQIAKLDFDYAKKPIITDLCVEMLSGSRQIPASNCLNWQIGLESYRPDLYVQLLEMMDLESAIVFLMSDSFENPSSVEPIFGTKYSARSFTEEEKNDFKAPKYSEEEHEMFKLPGPNKAIPKDTSMPPAEPTDKAPKILEETAEGKVYFRQELSYGQPKVVLSYSFLHGLGGLCERAELSLSLAIWELWFRQFAKYELYEFEKVKVKLKSNVISSRIQLIASGFTDSMPAFTTMLGQKLAEFRDSICDSPDFHRLFELRKEELEAVFDEKLNGDLVAFAMEERMNSLHSNGVSLTLQADALEALDFSTYLAVHRKIFAAFSFDALIFGACTAQQAKEIHGDFLSRLRKPGNVDEGAINSMATRVIQLGPESVVLAASPPCGENSNVFMSLALAGGRGLRATACMTMLDSHLSSGYFEALRTEKQLGYAVGVRNASLQRIPFLTFFIQSDKAGPGVCYAETRTFLANCIEKLPSLSDEQFDILKNGYLAQLKQPFPNLAKEAAYLFREIDNGQHVFDLNERLIEHTNSISKTEFIDFATKTLSPEYPFILHVFLEDLEADPELKALIGSPNVKLFEDNEEFLKQSQFFDNIKTLPPIL